jgi:hypothetical protein
MGTQDIAATMSCLLNSWNDKWVEADMGRSLRNTDTSEGLNIIA